MSSRLARRPPLRLAVNPDANVLALTFSEPGVAPALGRRLAASTDWTVASLGPEIARTRLWLESRYRGDDLGGRIGAVGRLLGPLMDLGLYRDLLPVAAWATRRYRADHPWDLSLRTPADPVRHEVLLAAKSQLLRPWLSGALPVRDLAAFGERHLGLRASEAKLLQVVDENNGWSPVPQFGPCGHGCHLGLDWSSEIERLVALGWLIITGGDRPILRHGSRRQRLNFAAGEADEI
jgi:hypothetical protein